MHLRARWTLQIAVTVAVVAIGIGCQAPAVPSPTPSGGILLVVLDTVRADHLGVDGYRHPTTPHLDRLAREGVYWRNAWSHSPWTLPSIASILTGQPPHVHGAGSADGRLFSIEPGVPTLAERLRGAGWTTAAVANVAFLSPRSGVARGFDHYDYDNPPKSNQGQRDAAATTDAALSWLRTVRDRPFFLFVHYFDAHLVYEPPPPYGTMFGVPGDDPSLPPAFGRLGDLMAIRSGDLILSPAQRAVLIARYDGEIRYVDEEFGRLRRGLESLDRWRDTMIVVVADHGEEFWDHGGFEHGHAHWRELLRVPLIVKTPGRKAGVVRNDLVRLLDITPTVLQFAGLPPDESLPGRPLRQGGPRHAIAQGTLWAGDVRSIRSEAGTLIVDAAQDREWYFAADDPLELHDLSGSEPEIVAPLRKALLALPPLGERASKGYEPDLETRARLRALGYLP